MAKDPAHVATGRSKSKWAIAGIALVVLAGTGSAAAVLVGSAHRSTSSAAARTEIRPLAVVTTAPVAQSAPVDPSSSITVDLSAALAPWSPTPTLSPPVPGTWSFATPTQLVFDPTGPMVPGSSETLTVPAGASGLLGAHGQHLGVPTTLSFTVAPLSTERLQQLLAQLGYLPLTFAPGDPLGSARQLADVQQGSFSWRWANQPSSLVSLWSEGTDNVITRGAVMDFESEHGLTSDGVAGPQVWADLLSAAASGAMDPHPYGYVYVSRTTPESTTVYQNGSVAYTTPANTGVPLAPTASGTFPVYARYRVTTMSGTNPDGSKYVDPGIPWVSYFNGGDALHGFVRASYGSPQSDGCVEMPLANAAVVWPMTPIGTLVTVG